MTAINPDAFLQWPVRKRQSFWSSIRETVTPKTLWWRQNEAREKSAQRGNQLVKQELAIVSTQQQQNHLIKSI